jgi:hypothetical protein
VLEKGSRQKFFVGEPPRIKDNSVDSAILLIRLQMVANEIDGAALSRTPLTGYREGGSFRPRQLGNTFRNA